MKKTDTAVVIRHVPHEGLGTIGRALSMRDVKVHDVRVYAGDSVPRSLPEGAALIVMGGPMGVYEADKYKFLSDEIRLIEKALYAGAPTLGVCLGAQLMAAAAGARVYKGGKKEIGWYGVELTEAGRCDALTAGLSDSMDVFQWHGDTFDVPRGASVLASSNLYEAQLVRMGRRAYAAQFHLEVTAKMIEEWITEEGNAIELAALKGEVDPAAILRDTPGRIDKLNKLGEAVFSRFLRM